MSSSSSSESTATATTTTTTTTTTKLNERIDADRKFVVREFIRMGFDKDAGWRISDINKNFELCNTYPRFLIIPACFKDDDLDSVAKFRYFRRVPTAVWRHLRNGCFIVRSSQPTVGWFGWFRNELDESLVQSYVNNTMPPNSEQQSQPMIVVAAAQIISKKDESVDNTTTTTTSGGDGNNIYDQSDHRQQTPIGKVHNEDGVLNSNHLPPETAAPNNPEFSFPNNQQSNQLSPTNENKQQDNPNSHNNNHSNTIPSACKETSDAIDSIADGPINEEQTQSENPNLTPETTTNGNGTIPLSGNVTPISPEKEDASTMTSKMLIIDARSYTAAMANRAKGGGCECSEYYQRCEIQFMNLANIHSIRKSYQAIRSVCESYSEQSNNWVSFLDNSRWLHHISGLLKSALLVVDTIDSEEKSILIHCSDGWDRTPQLVALAEIMLDSHYRTFEGFKTLIQREWLDFGHKFADRCGSNPCNEDPNERCPVFLQWLDCVQQLLVQYPRHFEFNALYLDKLNRHTYSNVFGTFSYNSTQERVLGRIDDKSPSLWAYFDSSRRRYRNDKYVDNGDILRPSFKVRDLHFWKEVYLPPVRNQASFMSVPDNIDNKKFYDSLYIDGLTRTVCK